MAMFKLSAVIPDDTSFVEAFDQIFETKSVTKKTALLDDNANSEMHFAGKGFHAQTMEIGGGTIDSVTFSVGSIVYGKLTGLHLSGSEISQSELGTDILTTLFMGKDKIMGSKGADSLSGFDGRDLLIGDAGNDTLAGGFGIDTLIGGKGSDHFIIRPANGNDVIRDFDAGGGGTAQDYIATGFGNEFTTYKQGHNVIVDFTDGADITLLNVKFRDIDPGDFI